MTEPIDTMNDCLVGVQGDHIVVLFPKTRFTPDEALRHAAWLVTLAEYGASHTFAEVQAAVRET